MAIMGNSSWPIYTNGPYQIVYHMDSAFSYLRTCWSDRQHDLRRAGRPGPRMAEYLRFAGDGLLQPEHPARGGVAYIMTSYVQNSGVTFQQNPTYWGANLTAAQDQGQPAHGPRTREDDIRQLQAGRPVKVHRPLHRARPIATIQSQDWQLVSSNPTEYGWVSFPPTANIAQSVAFNTHEYPMNITDVRLAIEHAINLSVIYQNVYNGAINPFFGPETPGFASTTTSADTRTTPTT